MSKIKFHFLVILILLVQVSYSQNVDFTNYAVALSEITTFADTPGFMQEITIEKSSKNIKWVTAEDGYNYTQDLQYIGLFGYKVLFKSNNNMILGVYYDSEGTAVYSYIFNVTTTGTLLKLNKIIAGGDRCHSGVKLDEIEIENNIMSFSSLITPNKLMGWFSETDNGMSFDDCMICCVGFANFKYDLNKNKSEFESVSVLEEGLQGNSSIKRAYDDFVKERPSKHLLSLNQKELKEFIKACNEK